MKKIVFGIGILLIISFVVFAAINSVAKKQNRSGKVEIVTTLFPLYDFAKNIGGDKVEVSLLLPPGVEAHTFDPKPSDIVKINDADLFVFTGKFMEPWAQDIINGLSNKNVKIVDSSAGIKMFSGVFNDADEPVGSLDPHIWLDFDNDKIIIKTIADALSERDPSNVAYYKQNADNHQNKLSALDEEYKTSLVSCNSKEVVYGGHYAFGYLANRYGLKYLAAQGVSPDSEPTAKDLVNLVDQIKKDNVKYVFYEELITPKIAETIANETNAKMLLLNGAHNLSRDQLESDISFLTIMENNLTNLKIGLKCDL